MNTSYALKTAARRLSELTGHPYQRCLGAVREQNLHALAPNPANAHPGDITDVAAAALAVSGQFPTPVAARRQLLQTTLQAVIRGHHADAVSAVVEMDEEEPHVGYLNCVTFADGEDLDGVIGEPVADDAFVWAHLFALACGLGPGESQEITIS